MFGDHIDHHRRGRGPLSSGRTLDGGARVGRERNRDAARGDKDGQLGWLKKGSPLDAQFTPKEYAEATEGLNVVKSVYMEVDVVAEMQQE